MALFPKVEFDVLVSGGAIVAGRRTDAILVLTTAHEIPRAQRIVVALRTALFLADPMFRELRRELRQRIFEQQLHIEVENVLAAGTHRLPFVLEAPAWLPPAFEGNGVRVAHELGLVLDVGWAADPHAELRAVVEPAPREGRRTPVSVRSPRDFHPSITLEIILDSAVIVHGEPVLGTVRIVSGGERDIDGVELSLQSTVTHVAGANQPLRSVFDARVFVAAAALFDGHAAPFEAPFAPFAPPSFANPQLRHELSLVVRLIRALVPPRTFAVPVEVLPKGSIVHSDSPVLSPLDHLRKWGIAIANATDLLPGTGTLVAHGSVGPVQIRIREAPRHMRTGLDIEYDLPGEAPMRPEDVPIAGDDEAAVVDAARRAVEHAKALARAVSAQPFPADISAADQAHWRAAAIDAFLIPAAPAIHGLLFPLRVLGTDERSVPVHIRTIAQRHLQITVDLRGMPLPESAIGPLQNGRVPALGFPVVTVSTNGDTLTLTRPSWASDPRALYPAIDAVLDWVLAARGERRAMAAYR